MSEFLNASRDIVTEFLQNVIIVDDLAINKYKTEPTKELKKAPGKVDVKSSSGAATTSSDDTEKDEHEVNLQDLTDTFASEGLLCSILNPKKEDTDFVNKSKKVLKKADIIILDWNIPIEGKASDYTVKQLIKEVVSDGEKHKQKALRYIAIYSGEEKLEEKLKSIKVELDSIEGMGDGKLDRYKLVYDHLQINIYAKKNQSGSTDPEIQKSEIELVDYIINDYTSLVYGLIPNMALQSLAEIRKNTHRLLNKFSKELDAAYLTHKAMLAEPKDAEELLIDLVTDELQSILDDSDISLTSETLSLWLDDRFKELKKADLQDGFRECYFNKDSYKTKEDFLSISSFCTIETERLHELAENFDTIKHFDNNKINNIIKKNRPYLKSKLQEDIHKCIIDGIDNHKDIPPYNTMQGNSLKFTKMFSQEHEKHNYTFATLSTLKTFYKKPNPYLTLGTILKKGDDYFISLLPRCDSARIDSPGGIFLLLPLIERGNKFEVMFEDKNIKKYQVDYSPKTLISIFFKQEEVDNSPLYAKKDGDKLIFKDENDNNYEWIAELKKEKSQNIANKFSAKLSRVGFNESEYLRRSY